MQCNVAIYYVKFSFSFRTCTTKVRIRKVSLKVDFTLSEIVDLYFKRAVLPNPTEPPLRTGLMQMTYMTLLQYRQWDPWWALDGSYESDIHPCVSETSFRPSRNVWAYD